MIALGLGLTDFTAKPLSVFDRHFAAARAVLVLANNMVPRPWPRWAVGAGTPWRSEIGTDYTAGGYRVKSPIYFANASLCTHGE